MVSTLRVRHPKAQNHLVHDLWPIARDCPGFPIGTGVKNQLIRRICINVFRTDVLRETPASIHFGVEDHAIWTGQNNPNASRVGAVGAV